MTGLEQRLKVALLSPGFDSTDVGEAFVAFKWAEALAREVDLTLLALQREGRPCLAEQIPNARVVTWREPSILLRAERLNAMMKPAWPLLFTKVRRWMRAAAARGESFDIAHQIMPLPPRYPSPFRGLGLPYVLGPVGGALPTPEGFRGEVRSGTWYTRLRKLDATRLERDPWLRASFSQADLVLGVAPYVADILAPVPLKRFEVELELGIDPVSTADPPHRPTNPRPLRLLHVGRGVRSKGLRDVVRALAQLRDLDLHLTSAGGGPEIDAAREEAQSLGVAERITFEGQVPRTRVNDLYAEADIFVFPSFREPTGGVLYEAMLAGLPIITAAYGGPDFIVTDACGLRLPVTTPDALARSVADAIRTMHDAPDRRLAMGRVARNEVLEKGLWSHKASRMVSLYREVLGGGGETQHQIRTKSSPT